MNKMTKTIAAAALLTATVLPISVFANNSATVPSVSETVQTQNQAATVVPATLGLITNFVNDQTGKFITVKGRGLAPIDQSEIILAITKDTKIVDAKGNKITLQTIIDEKRAVKAFYNPAITKSLPARGTALTLVVQDYSFTAIDGTVTEVMEQGIFVQGTDIYSHFEDGIILHFADNTRLIDQNGEELAAGDLQNGMTVRAFYGPAVMMSYPAQSTASYVMVNTEIQQTVENTEAAGTNGVITNISGDQMTVAGKQMEHGGVNYISLTIDEDTQIIDESGNVLTKDALKADVSVKVHYPNFVALSYPARSHADQIIVLNSQLIKVEGTIQESDRGGEGAVYLNVGSDSSIYNDVILNILEDTTIISLIPTDGDSPLKAGTKITAYHSPVMTRSLPGITNAHVIVVASDFDHSEEPLIMN